MSIELTDVQTEAVREIVAWYRGRASTPQEFYLAGYAGTGKSTVVAYALDELQAWGLVRRPVIGAYTGKAASVLRKKGNPNAMTIHGMTYVLVSDGDDEGETSSEPRFTLAIDGPASEADLIAIDEVSMVPDKIADDLRSFGKKILVIGDPGQLPPIDGAGAFINRRPDVFLREVHRQAADSPILQLATKARLGEPIEVGDYGSGVQVRKLTKATAELAYRDGTMPICGVHRVRWVVSQKIRAARGYEGTTPCAGETVLCCRNDFSLGLYNGAFGTVLDEPWDLDDGLLRMTVDMDDLPAPLKGLPVHPWMFAEHFTGKAIRPRIFKGTFEFDWGYALTCHKAQGSEFPDVTVVDDSAVFDRAGSADGRKWLYTALTRASERLTILQR